MWKEPIDFFNFLHRNNNQGKIAFKATSLGWVWPGVPLSQSDSRILSDHRYKEIIDTFI